MKKIINSKKYDTETAKLIELNESDYNRNDFNYFCERLYKKKTGEFFLHCEGGALSKYRTECGNERSGGSFLKPLDLEEAKHWLELHTFGDYYEEIFGEVKE